MRRYWPVVLAALVGVLLLVFLAGGKDVVDTITGGGAEHAPAPEPGEIELRGIERRRDETSEPPRPVEREAPPAPAEGEEEVEVLGGLVVDDASGRPLAGALVWLEGHAEPCPRLPFLTLEPGRLSLREDPLVTAVGPDAPPPARRFVSATTDEEGRFRLRMARSRLPASGAVDVFAAAALHAGAVVCGPAVPGEVTLRLVAAVPFACEVQDPDKRPVAGALVNVTPAPATPPVPGHAAAAVTDERGEARLDGLLPGEVMLEADHPAFVPTRSGPYEPDIDARVLVTLTPALRAVFRLRSDDGRPLKNVTVRWRTDGLPLQSELLLLRCEALDTKSEPGAELRCEAVRVPCNRKSVVFEVKADGYATWTSAEEPLPVRGEERTYDAVLSSDAGVGSVRVVIEDESGRVLRFDESRSSVVGVVRTDGPAATSGYVLEAGQELRFPSMPRGSYQVHLRSPAYAPLVVEAVVEAGRETEARGRARPPAKVRVRFVADEATIVRFRLSQDGRPVHAAPVDAPVARTNDDSKEPEYAAGEQGLLLSGLATGAYAVEVLNEDLAAPPTTVRVREGETEEVEIRVRRR